MIFITVNGYSLASHRFSIHFLKASCQDGELQGPTDDRPRFQCVHLSVWHRDFQPNSPLVLLNSRARKSPSCFHWYIYVSLFALPRSG
jgi:hypothetical protein